MDWNTFRHSLNWRLFLFMVPLSLLVGAGIYVAFFAVVSDSITSLAAYFAEQKVMFYADKATRILVRDRDIVARLSASPVLLDWVRDEGNAGLRKKAMALLVQHRPVLRDHSFFLVAARSGHYYYSQENGKAPDQSFRYTLSKHRLRDAWYYATLAKGQKCSLNVNHDDVLNVTKVWINCLMQADGQAVGMLGTGIDLSEFIRTVVESKQPGVSNIYINKDGFIQAAPHVDMIDFASITHEGGEGRRIFDLFDRPQDRQAFTRLMQHVGEPAVRSLTVQLHGVPYVVALSAIEGIPWFNTSFVNINEQHIREYFMPFAVLLGLAMASLMVLLLWFVRRMILQRLKRLDANVALLRNRNFSIDCADHAEDEIGRLSRSFCEMANDMQRYTKRLENTVAERTAALRQAVHEAEAGRKYLDALIQHARDAIMHIDNQGRIRSFNPASEAMFGYQRDDVLGKSVSCLFDVEKQAPGAAWWAALTHEDVLEMKGLRRDGRRFPVELSLNVMPVVHEDHYIVVIRDISERRQVEARIRQLAHFDALTGLPNRALFLDRLQQALTSARRMGESFSLFFLDLDGFKDINDRWGHKAGDLVLCCVAGRLRACVREMDTVARLGGDEFTMILSGVGEDAQVERLLQKVRDEVARPMRIDGYDALFRLGVSIGVAIYPQHGSSMDELLSYADQAMYKCKRNGGRR